MDLIRRWLRSERGGTAIEYGLICSLVIIAMIGALETFAGSTINMYNHVATAVSNAAPAN
ncbi:MAG TPA: Flp family type IVb pilin [Sphingomonas sp.]|nr:Flp family type IVb pilin [Sphingomonas sp.]